MPFFVADRGRVFSALSFVLLLRYREVAGLRGGRMLDSMGSTTEGKKTTGGSERLRVDVGA